MSDKDQKTISIDLMRAHGEYVPVLSISTYQQLQDDHYKESALLQDLFEKQAEDLLSALTQSLPGGTMDALLRLQLEHRKSQMIVPSTHKPKEKTNDR